MYKCNKEDPNNARNEETENRSVEMPMRRLIKITVAGKPIAPIIVPDSRYVNARAGEVTTLGGGSGGPPGAGSGWGRPWSRQRPGSWRRRLACGRRGWG